MSDSGSLRAIYVRPSSRTPVKRVERAQAEAGQGLVEDHAGGGKRQVTLLSQEAWDAACAELGQTLDPGLRRANLVVQGVDLGAAIGKELTVGAVRIKVVGETKPCQLMDDQAPGLHDALRPACRGGVFGQILEGGELEPGQPVRVQA
ncbi:MAG: MOSC domain-containing protein [Planctomycetota bacterium]